MRRRQRIANEEIEKYCRIAQYPDGAHKPSMSVRLHMQSEISLKRDPGEWAEYLVNPA